MKAVVWRGDRTLDIETVEDARLEAPTDVLMRLTSTAICGTDLHIYEGRMGDANGMVIGHEPLGVVEEVGSAVVSIRKGDRVVVIGVFLPNDAKPVGEIEKRGDLTVPWQTLFRKGITIG